MNHPNRSLNKRPSAYFLLWNPDIDFWELPASGKPSYGKCVEKIRRGRDVGWTWSAGNTKSIQPGDRLYLLRTGRDHGLVGSGVAMTKPYPETARGDSRWVLDVRFDTLVFPNDRIPKTKLQQLFPEVKWNQLYACGIGVPDAVLGPLERTWQRHIAKVARRVEQHAAELGNASSKRPRGLQGISRALAVGQPYAELILQGKKKAEYRSWRTHIRGRVFVYASRSTSDDIDDWRRAGFCPGELPSGLILGTVEVVDCIEEPNRYAWRLARPRRLRRPLRPTGMPQPGWFRAFED